MYANANRIKALHQLKQAVQALTTAECGKNTYSMAYANASEATPRRRNALRDKLEQACGDVLFFEHEAHCCAVEAGLAEPEPSRYGLPVFSYTAAGDQLHHGTRRYPVNTNGEGRIVPFSNVVVSHHVNR